MSAAVFAAPLVLALLAGGPACARAAEPGEESKSLEELARAELKAENYAEAARLAERATQVHAGNVGAYNLLSVAQNKLRRFDLAADAARRGIAAMGKREEGRASLYENLSFALLNQGDAEAAVQSASLAIESSQSRGARPFALRAFAAELKELEAARKGAKRDAEAEAGAKLADIRRAAELQPAEFSALAAAAERGERIFVREEAAPEPLSALLALSQAPEAWAGLALLLLVCGGLVLSLRLRGEEARGPVLGSAAPLLSGASDGLLAGKYELSRVIGKGGMGEVWQAKDASLGRPVAIKRMTAALEAMGAQAKEYYLKEAKTLASLHHHAIVDIYEILDLPSGMHLVFELVSGKTVQQILVERKRLEIGRIKEILRPVCEALEYAHARGIVHRDLKPSNIMVTDQGYVKVMDFGIARRSEEVVRAAGPGSPSAAPAVLKTQTIIGTPAYMPAEAMEGLVSAGSDVFSLGVCLYEMATGELPFGNEGQASGAPYVAAHVRAPGLPPALDAMLREAMAPLKERVPGVPEFLARLESIPS